MQITVTTESGGIFPLDVSGELTLEDLKGLLEIEVGTEATKMLLIHNMSPMTEDGKTLGAYGVENDDIITVTEFTGPITTGVPAPLAQPASTGADISAGLLPTIASGQSQATAASQREGGASVLPEINWEAIHLPTGGERGGRRGPSRGRGHNPRQRPYPPQQQQQDPDDPEVVRQHFLSNPYELAALQERNPPLAEALLSGDNQQWREALERHKAAVRDREMQRIRMLNADPMDPDVQQRISQEIQQRNIQENMEAALEYTPETFTRVVMLYISCKVNGVPVKVLVDSGARSTVMSARCAERCNIMRLVDRRFSGVAFGVGRQKILGRVHLGQIQIGNDFITSSFQVLEEAAEDMLLGLDMLRKHLCCIDLEKNVLRIGSTGREAPFLTEKDLHEKEEMVKEQSALGMEDEDEQMARAVAKSEEEYEGQIMDTSRHDQGGSNQAGHPSASAGSTSTTSSVTQTGTMPTSLPLPTPSSSANQLQSFSTTPVVSPQFSEADIQQITSAGFSREEAIQELVACRGSVQLALTSLLAKSIKL